MWVVESSAEVVVATFASYEEARAYAQGSGEAVRVVEEQA